ncbi:MAG: cell division protein ZapA [Thiocapsa sp.]|nr:cell division protein ZapA [Thiocapsa sp.]MCG6896097.1 cell division protein ZapA [Thiocapsa sp.]MCG6985192.1 cell division protein ZapA [Thiocapsa sp.]
MNEEPIQVNIRILDKDYRIACEPHEQEGLHESARLLDGKMREIRQTGRVIGTDRIAVMAALNIAHDLVQLQKVHSGAEEDGETTRRLRHLQERVSQTLAAEPTLDASGERV